MSSHGLSRTGWDLLLGALWEQRRALARLTGWSLVAALPALLSGRLVALAVDHGFLRRREGVGIAWLALLVLVMAVGALGSRQVFAWLGAVVEPLRDRLARVAVTGALRRCATTLERPEASAVARLTTQVETVRDVVAGLLLTLRQVVFTLIASLLGIFSLAPLLLLLIAPPLLLALCIFALLMVALAPRQRALVLADEKIAESVGTAIGAIRDVVACGAERPVTDAVAVDINAQARAARTLAKRRVLRMVVTALGVKLPLVLILLAAPWLISHERVTTGEILGAVTYLIINLEPAMNHLVGTIGSSGLRLVVVLRRIAEASALPAEDDDDDEAADITPPCYDIDLRNVTFAHGQLAEPIVRNLSLSLPQDQHLAIVGPSGVGKSTLANLIVGIVPPRDGEILIGNVPLEALGERHLRRVMALIPQESYVFAGTLRENLTYLRPDADTADLDDAVQALALHPLVQQLGGYDVEIGPGQSALSAGEQQLIALARVYLSSAAIVVLDEATCHLDPPAEARVETAFSRRGGTLIVIAHRISSALRANRILLMEGGRTLVGTHDELLSRSSLYQDLVGYWEGEPDRAPAVPDGDLLADRIGR